MADGSAPLTPDELAREAFIRLAPDDLIREILLRLPSHPARLLCVSRVCRHWRRLVRDPGFLRRFRARHRHAAPLLGFFGEDASFIPAGELPDRVTVPHFCLRSESWRVLGCRHGRVLLGSTYTRKPGGRGTYRPLQLLVWDPAGSSALSIFPGPRHLQIRHHVPLPIHGSLICGYGVRDHDGHDEDCSSRPFRVVILFYHENSIFAGVYSSQTFWCDLVAFDVPRDIFDSIQPGVLVGNTMYWLSSQEGKILAYYLDTNWLHLIESLPSDAHGPYDFYKIVEEAIYGCLSVAALRGSRLHLFAHITNSEGTETWSEYKTIELDTIQLLLPPLKAIEVSDEDRNIIFLETMNGVFELHIKSMEVRKVLQCDVEPSTMVAYRTFYVTGGSVVDKDWTLLGKCSSKGDRIRWMTWG